MVSALVRTTSNHFSYHPFAPLCSHQSLFCTPLATLPLQCKILLASGADVLLKDRWGNSAVDDARRVEAMPVVKLLEPMIAEVSCCGNLHFSGDLTAQCA